MRSNEEFFVSRQSGFMNARTGVRGACSNAATSARHDSDSDSDSGDADFPALAGSAAPRSQFSTDSASQSFDEKPLVTGTHCRHATSASA
jgi:hypothetical protein